MLEPQNQLVPPHPCNDVAYLTNAEALVTLTFVGGEIGDYGNLLSGCFLLLYVLHQYFVLASDIPLSPLASHLAWVVGEAFLALEKYWIRLLEILVLVIVLLFLFWMVEAVSPRWAAWLELV